MLEVKISVRLANGSPCWSRSLVSGLIKLLGTYFSAATCPLQGGNAVDKSGRHTSPVKHDSLPDLAHPVNYPAAAY